MKRRSFLRLLGTALGLGVLSRRTPAIEVEAISAAPAVLGFDVARGKTMCDRATEFGNAEAARFAAEIVQRSPRAWLLNPETHCWEQTFEFGPNLRNMAVPKRTLPLVIEDRAPWK